MTKITIITGSTLGSSEYVAEYLADNLTNHVIETTILHGPHLSEILLEGIWLIITSTHGAGDLPDNLKPFYEQLVEKKPNLSKVKYGAIGLGSSEYDTFCAGIKLVDQQLQLLGASRIGTRLEIDVTQHEIPEDPAEIWLTGWINLL